MQHAISSHTQNACVNTQPSHTNAKFTLERNACERTHTNRLARELDGADEEDQQYVQNAKSSLTHTSGEHTQRSLTRSTYLLKYKVCAGAHTNQIARALACGDKNTTIVCNTQ